MNLQLDKVFLISVATIKDLLKSKALMNVLILGSVILITTWISTEFSYGTPGRVALDIGLGLLSLSSYFLAVFFGMGLIAKEIETRTVYVILSRPVSRSSFIAGKILGLSIFLALNILLLSAVTISATYFSGGAVTGLGVWAIVLTLVESVLLLLLVVVISLLANPVLTVIVSVTLLFSGHAISEVWDILIVRQSPVLQMILKAYHFALPGFYKLNIKPYVLYEQVFDFTLVSSGLAYGVIYSLALFLLAIIIFSNKSLD